MPRFQTVMLTKITLQCRHANLHPRSCYPNRAAQAEQEKQRQRQQQQGDGSADDAEASNATTAEDAGAIIVYHETILKLKRILLNYM
jgi:hypothetical protein